MAVQSDSRMLSDAVLLGFSVCALVLGLAFPIGAKLFNPFLAYGIVFVSAPAWLLGVLTGALAAIRGRKATPPRPGSVKWGWILCLSNVLVALVTLAIPFHAS
jgi:hypothetical protein